MKLKELAELLNGKIIGNPDIEIKNIASISEAKNGDLTFLASGKYIDALKESNASAVIAREVVVGISKTFLLVENPYYTFARALEIFYQKPCVPIGVSKGAYIGKDVSLGAAISIYPNTYIADRACIGDSTAIYPNSYIGEGVEIGNNCIIYPNVVIRENVRVGDNVIIHAGAVIGADGFGYVQVAERHYKIPQVGGVIIEDDVEIGANVTIDRATLGFTVIGKGTKIDNLVQIAHNVTVGKGSLIVAQVGIGGSTELGNGVVLAGQVGVKDHIKIGSRVMVGAQSGIGHDIPDEQAFSGSPAIPHKDWLKAQAIFSKLPEVIKRIRALETKVKNLEGEVKNNGCP
ncbi:MAG TPA: UDP-3-O-(3-hydroxymyristoyl)glucosamine N-acyltransferase [Nitrospiraceae bacterium]|nr:UDP-3-O-(3-hydroxymyristoyl)glucosamine N-acyltransferase [Nitrospiraceae bacterium]